MTLNRTEAYAQVEELGSIHQMSAHEKIDDIFDQAGMTGDKRRVIWIVRDARDENSTTFRWTGNWCVMEKVDQFFQTHALSRPGVMEHYRMEKLANTEFYLLGPIRLLDGETFDNIREKLSHIYAPLLKQMAEPLS